MKIIEHKPQRIVKSRYLGLYYFTAKIGLYVNLVNEILQINKTYTIIHTWLIITLITSNYNNLQCTRSQLQATIQTSSPTNECTITGNISKSNFFYLKFNNFAF